MKHIATMALMVSLGVAGVYAQEIHVKMTFSGNGSASAIDLKQPDPTPWKRMSPGTVRSARSRFELSGLPQLLRNRPPLARATFFPAWPAVRHSLSGWDSIEGQSEGRRRLHRFRANEGHCTLIFEINGGTGRFQNASGLLTYVENAEPVLFDAPGMSVALGTEVGEITGTISGVGQDQDRKLER